ncbi:MAG TPA: hypothetical protein PKB02_18485 [Anaerohalosphaeraceae bacterium]|nr:hypothetical protein [Anaerohalosphaeraceae bacterium]
MIKKVIVFIPIGVIICIVLFILNHWYIGRPLSLKEKIIQEEKGYVYNAFNPPSESQKESIEKSKKFISRLENMDKIEPPFVLKSADFSVQKDSHGEYVGCTIIWYEDGYNTKGFRIKNTSQEILKDVSFPEEFRDYNNTASKTEKLARAFSFKIIPGKETKWSSHNLLMMTVPSDVFESPVYLTLYDSQGVECESVQCERIMKLSGKGSAVSTEPNLILWEKGGIEK